jgi:hypothetical protein
MAPDAADTGDLPGTPERIAGTAYNAKAGAVLRADDGRMMYVEGLQEWDDDVVGTPVTLTGIVSVKKIFPDPIVDGGMIGQGMVGETLVLTPTEPMSS